MTGVDQFGTGRSVSAASIKSFWDYTYGLFYSSSGVEDPSVNCHGFAFIHQTWIEDPSYIDADDLQGAADNNDTEYFRQGADHTIVWWGDESDTTAEKNGPSRIYWTTWYFSDPTGTRKTRLYQ